MDRNLRATLFGLESIEIANAFGRIYDKDRKHPFLPTDDEISNGYIDSLLSLGLIDRCVAAETVEDDAATDKKQSYIVSESGRLIHPIDFSTAIDLTPGEFNRLCYIYHKGEKGYNLTCLSDDLNDSLTERKYLKREAHKRKTKGFVLCTNEHVIERLGFNEEDRYYIEIIRGHGGINPKELFELSNESRSRAGRIIQKLIRSGHIVSLDGREYNEYKLTEKGKRVIYFWNEMFPAIQETFPSSKYRMLDYLCKLADRLHIDTEVVPRPGNSFLVARNAEMKCLVEDDSVKLYDTRERVEGYAMEVRPTGKFNYLVRLGEVKGWIDHMERHSHDTGRLVSMLEERLDIALLFDLLDNIISSEGKQRQSTHYYRRRSSGVGKMLSDVLEPDTETTEDEYDVEEIDKGAEVIEF